ncbi:MAG TPA: hypothetical protein VND44_01725 [Acidimicrobiales bacterium]|nr:hypothetical protein [Acidimicrobiales bacterium]
MDTSARAPAAPVVPEDDPWAGLADPGSPSVPAPGDVVLPVMPWDAPGSPDGTAAPEPDDGPVAGGPADAPVVPAPVPSVGSAPPRPQLSESESESESEPEPVPTAVAASASRVSFPPGVAAKLGAYVYLLVDARTGRPFHVARGRGDRCFRHVEAARPSVAGTGPNGAAASRFPALDRIGEAESDGRPVRIEILRYGLTGPEADLVVAAVDDVLALGIDARLGSQRTAAVELGASLAKRAKIKRGHQAVLLRVGVHGTDTAYAGARHGWRIGRRWVDTGSVRSPKWALLVAGDLVDSVYRIDGWEPAPATGAPGAVERWSFTGERDAELEARYVGRSVAAYLGAGTPSQVTYVWCGPHWVNTAQ